MKFFAAGVVSLMVSLAFAEELMEPIKFTGTANAYNSSSVKTTDIMNPAKWSLGEGVTELPSDRDYIIANEKYCGFGGDGKFPGKSLTLGVVRGASGNLSAITDISFKFDFGTLILNNGIIETKIKATADISADIAVNAEPEHPYEIKFNGSYNSRINLTGSINGEGALRVYTGKQGNEYMLARVKSKMDGFSGIIEVGSPTAAATIAYRSPVLFGDSTINGEIKVNPCGVVGPCGNGDNLGEFSVKRLTFNGGGAVRVGVNSTTGGTIRVTEKLTLPADGKVTLDVAALPGNSLAGRRHAVLVVPASSGMQESDFELKAVGKAGGELYGKLQDCSLCVETLDGCDILYIDLGKYTVHNAKADGWDTSSWAPEYSSRWSGVDENTPMNSDTTYVSYESEMVSLGGEVEFPGKRLVLSGRDILFACRKMTVNDFHIMNAAELRFWSQSVIDLYGKITLSNPASSGTALELLQSQGYTAKIHSDISGSAGIKIIGALKNGSSRPSSGSVILSGMNTAFTGRISLTNECGSVGTNITLRVSDIRALGGPMSAFAYNAYSFQEWSRFQADADLAIVDSTRGVYFEGNAYVKIPNASHTLTLATQTTMAGTLVKEGAGTLALGGVLKFTKNQDDDPLEGTNILRVAEGFIKPASKSGADGLAIAFAAGTALALSPLAETDADVAQFGLYNEKWAEPFDLTDSDGKLEVKLDLPEDLPISFSFGVCTVSASAAESLRGKIELPKVSRYSCSISESSIEYGTVTFTATYTRPAFTISIR